MPENKQEGKKCKCQWPGGVVIKPDGVNEVDPCQYKEIQRFANVTVIISRCIHCGNIDISWVRQENTEELPVDE